MLPDHEYPIPQREPLIRIIRNRRIHRGMADRNACRRRNHSPVEVAEAGLPVVGGGKPIQRGLINPEGDQSAFGDETAEVMGSNGAMIVPQDIKRKQTVRQDFRQCLIIAPRSSTCRVQLHWRLGQGADDGRMARVAEAWDRSRAPGATSRSTISSASVRLQRLRLACRSGARLIPVLATRHGRARPGHACLWTDILNPL